MTRSWSFLLLLGAAASSASGFQGADAARITAERDAAIEQVKRIVNQPVRAVPYSADAHVGRFSPGWFHDGAARPDFLRVDVRATQQFPYDQFEFVTSDVSPGVMFRGADLEFNANTKFFYTDRTLPKKKLTPEEMVEINRLYRIIGEGEPRLARPVETTAPPPIQEAPSSSAETRSLLTYATTAVVGAALAIALYRTFASRS